jgi:hypothetical protein
LKIAANLKTFKEVAIANNFTQMQTQVMFKEQKIQISYTTMPKFQMEGLQQK